MNNKQLEIVNQIINTEGTLNKISILNQNMELLKNIKIVLFDENHSFFNHFEAKSWGKYHLCALGDYNKCWILDGGDISNMRLNVSKKVYFDINILSRLDEYYHGKTIADQDDFVRFILHLKDEKYDLEIGNSVIEQIKKKYNERLFKQSIKSFYDFSLYKNVNSENDSFDEYYSKCKNIARMLDDESLKRQYKFILCILTKAICLKADKKISNKIDELIKFSINELKCMMVHELYLLCLYLTNDPSVKKIFAKFHTSIKGGLENAVKNTAWDIYYARLIEQEMRLYACENKTIELPYFATNDQGVKDYIALNPRKIVVIDNGIAKNVYAHNVGDIGLMLSDNKIYEQIVDPIEVQKRNDDIVGVKIDDILDILLNDLKSIKI